MGETALAIAGAVAAGATVPVWPDKRGREDDTYALFWEWLLENGELQHLPAPALRVPVPNYRGPGPVGRCYANAFDVIDTGEVDPEIWSYTEGVIYAPGYGQVIHHAWLSNNKGQALDPTGTTQRGDVYLGVPFKWDFARARMMQRGCHGIFFDGELYHPVCCSPLPDHVRAWPAAA